MNKVQGEGLRQLPMQNLELHREATAVVSQYYEFLEKTEWEGAWSLIHPAVKDRVGLDDALMHASVTGSMHSKDLVRRGKFSVAGSPDDPSRCTVHIMVEAADGRKVAAATAILLRDDSGELRIWFITPSIWNYVFIERTLPPDVAHVQ